MGGKTQPQQDTTTGRSRGTVQHTYPERGFGFIRCTQGPAADIGQDFFFHASGLDQGLHMTDLLPGSLVDFDSTAVPRGKRAEHISWARTTGETSHAATERAARS